MMFRYLTLDYCRNSTDVSGRRIAVVAVPYEATQAAGLVVLTSEGWSQEMPASDEEYIHAVLDDLAELDPDECASHYSMLTEMSAGVLRTGDQGVCRETELSGLAGIVSAV